MRWSRPRCRGSTCCRLRSICRGRKSSGGDGRSTHGGEAFDEVGGAGDLPEDCPPSSAVTVNALVASKQLLYRFSAKFLRSKG